MIDQPWIVRLSFQMFGHQFFSFDSSEKNREFSHRGEKISVKFKVTFCCQIALLLISTGVLLYFHESISELKFYKQLSAILLSEVWLVLSFISTSKVKSVFRLHEDIEDIFRKGLGFDEKRFVFHRNFNKLFWIHCAIVVITIVAEFRVFFLNADRYALFYAASNSLRVLIKAHIFLRFLFYTRLIHYNVALVQEAVVGLSPGQEVLLYNDGSSEGAEAFLKFTSLKEIYGKIWKMTDLINDIKGPVLIILIIFGFTLSAFDGLKAFTFLKSGKIQEATGLRHLMNVSLFF